jgi:hypothetical protein
LTENSESQAASPAQLPLDPLRERALLLTLAGIQFGWRFPFIFIALLAVGFLLLGWKLLPALRGHLASAIVSETECAHPLSAMLAVLLRLGGLRGGRLRRPDQDAHRARPRENRPLSLTLFPQAGRGDCPDIFV